MLDLLRSGAALTLPLLPHLLRAKGAARPGSSAAGGGGGVQPAPALRAAEPPASPEDPGSSPSYSCTDEEEAASLAAAAGAAADGLLESPAVQAARIAQQFSLNQEQAEVLQYVAGWAAISAGTGSASKRPGSGTSAAPGAPPPVCLVHGPFGSGARLVEGEGCKAWAGRVMSLQASYDWLAVAPLPSSSLRAGKSTLLVALLHFLLAQRGVQGSPLAGARVLVSAHTNVAVDRVLTGALAGPAMPAWLGLPAAAAGRCAAI